jgi:hypothetical protein
MEFKALFRGFEDARITRVRYIYIHRTMVRSTWIYNVAIGVYMALITYLPLLRVLLLRVCKYIGEHKEKIIANVGEEHRGTVETCNDVCSSLVAILDEVIPKPT